MEELLQISAEAVFALSGLIFWIASMITTILLTKARLEDLDKKVSDSLTNIRTFLSEEVLKLLRDVQREQAKQAMQIAAIEARCAERAKYHAKPD